MFCKINVILSFVEMVANLQTMHVNFENVIVCPYRFPHCLMHIALTFSALTFSDRFMSCSIYSIFNLQH